MDFFSGHAKLYAEFRPNYPEELYHFLSKHVTHFDNAWDCGTGNGQVAVDLIKYFTRVDATDISEEQLGNAARHSSIHYHHCQAEQTTFEDHSFDLVCVAQAIHWFDLEKFYHEVRRVVKPGGVIAVWGYNICSVDEVVDPTLQDYYRNVAGSYWHPRRKLIEDAYQTIPFPFVEIACPKFTINQEWSLGHFVGYLTSWSATQNYIKQIGRNPAEAVGEKLSSHWSSYDTKQVSFPIFMRIGIIK
jgi:SAM-dependent methyltransferase